MLTNRIATPVILAIAIAIFVGVAYLGDYTPEQVGAFIGYIIGVSAAISGVFWIARSRLPKLNRIAIALLAGVLLYAVQHTEEVRSAYEASEARSLIVTRADAQNIQAISAAHPHNRMLAAMNIFSTNGIENRKNIYDSIMSAAKLPPDADQPITSQSPEQLAATAAACRAAVQKLEKVQVDIPALYKVEFEKAAEGIKKIGNWSFGQGGLEGLTKRIAIERDYHSRLAQAYQTLYTDLAMSADFLVANAGTVAEDKKSIIFEKPEAVDAWNSIYDTLQADISRLQAFDAEAASFNQHQAALFSKIEAN